MAYRVLLEGLSCIGHGHTVLASLGLFEFVIVERKVLVSCEKDVYGINFGIFQTILSDGLS